MTQFQNPAGVVPGYPQQGQPQQQYPQQGQPQQQYPQQGQQQYPQQGFQPPNPTQPQQGPNLRAMLQGATMGDDRLPLLEGPAPGGTGNYLLRLGRNYFGQSGTMKTEAEIVESDVASRPPGTKVHILSGLGGNSEQQRRAKQDEFLRYVVRAFGFNSDAELSVARPGWYEELAQEPGPFMGRLIRVTVYDDGTRTSARSKKPGSIIWKEQWNPSVVEGQGDPPGPKPGPVQQVQAAAPVPQQAVPQQGPPATAGQQSYQPSPYAQPPAAAPQGPPVVPQFGTPPTQGNGQ